MIIWSGSNSIFQSINYNNLMSLDCVFQKYCVILINFTLYMVHSFQIYRKVGQINGRFIWMICFYFFFFTRAQIQDVKTTGACYWGWALIMYVIHIRSAIPPSSLYVQTAITWKIEHVCMCISLYFDVMMSLIMYEDNRNVKHTYNYHHSTYKS